MKKTLLLTLIISLVLLFSVSAIDFPVDVPRTLTISSDQDYDYQNSNSFFSVWYGDDPSTGNVVKFEADGIEMTLLPMALNYNNDLSQLQQISMPQSVSGSPSGSDMVYEDAYGSNIDLIYETQQDKVKERLIINSRSDLPNPAEYVVNGGNVQLELGFQLASNGKIFLDGIEWDKDSEVSTINDVLVKNDENKIVYTLPRPYAIDSNNNIEFGHYVFKETANKLYVRIYIPFDWLNNIAVYPVTIDPTFQVDYSPVPAYHITNLISDTEDDSQGIATDVTSGVSDNSTGTTYSTVDANNGQVLVGKWNMEVYTNYTGYTIWLRMYKTSGGSPVNFNVYPYLGNNDSINTTYFKQVASGLGAGWFNINVTDLIKYEYDNGNAHIQLRFFAQSTSSYSEMMLRVETNDILPPVITNCTVNSTSLSCNESAYLNCHVTDNVDVQYVNFTLNSNTYQATQNINDYYYILGNTGAGNYTYDWNNVYAEDLFGQYSNYDPNLTINYYCCIEDWQPNPIYCQTNDTYLLTYYDTNACGTVDDLPVNNGTYQYCNYCSEDLSMMLGTCQANSTQTVDWIDNNYFTCCYVTGLPSDCSIFTYPFNETTYQSCVFAENQLGNITCQNEPNFNIREKEYCLAWIPNQYLNESFKCISYVVELSSLEILQTNPEYRERAGTFLDLTRQDPETREYFTPANSIVNFYYTGKNLNPENDYMLTIECSSLQRTLKSQKLFQMAYEDYQFVFFRTRWLMANAGYIIGGLFLLFIIIFVLWWFFKQAT